LTIFVNSNQYI